MAFNISTNTISMIFAKKKTLGFYMDTIFRKINPYKWNVVYIFWEKKKKVVFKQITSL